MAYVDLTTLNIIKKWAWKLWYPDWFSSKLQMKIVPVVVVMLDVVVVLLLVSCILTDLWNLGPIGLVLGLAPPRAVIWSSVFDMWPAKRQIKQIIEEPVWHGWIVGLTLMTFVMHMGSSPGLSRQRCKNDGHHVMCKRDPPLGAGLGSRENPWFLG